MDGLLETVRLKQRRLLLIAVALVLIICTLLALGQPVAAGLIPLIAVLVIELNWRDARARTLAERISTGQTTEKLEVPRGAWGELCRAVNVMLQQRRVQQRLQAAAPAPLPDEAVRSILEGGLYNIGEPRMVTVLMVSCGGIRRVDSRIRRSAVLAWQSLANAAQEQAQQYGALLQPCGDALMLVFGAFNERPIDVTARAALAAAESLQQGWRAGGATISGPLTFSLASGMAVVTVLPGMGCCVLGAPVQQAGQILQLALNTRYEGLLCGEEIYYALRHSRASWQATPLSIAVPNRPPLDVYSWRSAS